MTDVVEIHIPVRMRIVEKITDDVVARIHYPNEGNEILVTKGLNAIEFGEAIHHEIGHLYDWYLSGKQQAGTVEQREKNTCKIADAIRFGSR